MRLYLQFILSLLVLCLDVDAACPGSGDQFRISTQVGGVNYFLLSPAAQVDFVNLNTSPDLAALFQLTPNGTAMVVGTDRSLTFAANGEVEYPEPYYVYTPVVNTGSFFPVTLTCANGIFSITDYEFVATQIVSGQTSVISCPYGPGNANVLYGLSKDPVTFPGYSTNGPCTDVLLSAVAATDTSAVASQSLQGSRQSSSNAPLYHNTTTYNTQISQPTSIAGPETIAANNAVQINILTTRIANAYTTVLEEDTTFIENKMTYTGVAGQTLTITDCPCTITTQVEAPSISASPAAQIIYVYVACMQASDSTSLASTASVSICSACPEVTLSAISQSGTLVVVSSTITSYTCPTAGTYAIGTRRVTAVQSTVATFVQPLTTTYEYIVVSERYLDIIVLAEQFIDYTVTTSITTIENLLQVSAAVTIAATPVAIPKTQAITTLATSAITAAYQNTSSSTSSTTPTTSCTTFLYVPQVTQYLAVDPAGHLVTDSLDTNYTAVDIDSAGRLINSTGGAVYFIDSTEEDDYLYPYANTGYGLIYQEGVTDGFELANGSTSPPHEPDANGLLTTFSVDMRGFLHFAANGEPYQFQFCPVGTANQSGSGAQGNHISLFPRLLPGCEAYDVQLNITCS